MGIEFISKSAMPNELSRKMREELDRLVELRLWQCLPDEQRRQMNA